MPKNTFPFRLASWTALSLLLSSCGGVMDPLGPVGEADKIIMLDSLAIMLAIVIPTIIATIVFAWWFRAGNTKATYLPDWAYSGRLELIVWAIPTLVILFLGGITWIGSHDLDPAHPLEGDAKPLEVQAVAMDWKWLFIYPEQNIASVNRLVIPAGQPVHFQITSSSVFNGFFIPQLGSQIYAMNGMSTQLNLKADKPGVMPGIAAHFSGDGFSDMHFDVEAVTADTFTAWSNNARTGGEALNDTSYHALLKPSQNIKPYTYRSVQPGIFDAIVSLKLPPGEGALIEKEK